MSIYVMTHDSTKLRWQLDMNEGDDILVFEGHLQTTVEAHIDATIWAHKGCSSVYVIPSMWKLVKLRVKEDVKCTLVVSN